MAVVHHASLQHRLRVSRGRMVNRLVASESGRDIGDNRPCAQQSHQ
jgi:hypothetical protein